MPRSSSKRRPAKRAPRDEFAQWRAALIEARAQFEAARKRKAAAQQAWRRARHLQRPRGESRAGLWNELRESSVALEEARARLPLLREQARRAGAPPGVLREAEEAE